MGIKCFQKFCCGDDDDGNDPLFIEKKIFKLILIGAINNEELIKVKEFIEDHYFGSNNIKHNPENKENISYNNELDITITNDFYKYKDKQYDLVISFLNTKEENIAIINTFKTTYYLLHKICSKDELIKATNDLVTTENLLLTNHFRIKINNFLGWNKNEPLSESTFSGNNLEDL